jgi:hypothetical protein
MSLSDFLRIVRRFARLTEHLGQDIPRGLHPPSAVRAADRQQGNHRSMSSAKSKTRSGAESWHHLTVDQQLDALEGEQPRVLRELR